LAAIWLDQGAPARALPYLVRLRKEAPQNLGARMKFATTLSALGRIEDARKEAVALLEKPPASAEALLLLSETIRNSSDIEELEKELKKFPNASVPLAQASSANLMILKGDFASARRSLQRALLQEPKSPEVHSVFAKFYLRQGEATKAAEAIKSAADNSAARSPFRLRHAEYLAQRGAVKEALSYVQEILRLAPDYLPAKGLQATLAIADKRYDEASGILKEILARDGFNVEAHVLRAQIHFAKNEGKQAVEELAGLLKQFPGLGVISYQLARAHLQLGNPALAIEVLQKGVAANPDHVDSSLLLAEVNLRRGNAEAAARVLSTLLQQYPGHTIVQSRFVETLRSLGRYDEAAGVVREQIRVAPGNPQLHVVLGSILRQQGKMAEATKSFETALAMAPDFTPALSELIDQNVAEKRFGTALERLAALKAKNATSPVAHYLEGRVHAAQSQWGSAEVALQKAIELDASLAAAYDLLLYVYMSSNRLAQALAQVESALTRNPENPPALTLSGMIHARMGNAEKARDSYEKVLKFRPNSPAVLNNLAYLYGEQLNQLERAAELGMRARALEPNSAEIADTLGWIHYKRKDYTAALVLLQESAAKLPQNPEVRFHLGMTLLMSGDAKAALKELQLAVGAKGDFPGKDEARRQVVALESGRAP
jgi:tetratricopeptide (TPR) repeat protein